MHDIGLNMSQLEMSMGHIDDTIGLAREWTHQLLHATEQYDMNRASAKLTAVMSALDEACTALEGYADAIEADHNAIGSVRIV